MYSMVFRVLHAAAAAGFVMFGTLEQSRAAAAELQASSAPIEPVSPAVRVFTIDPGILLSDSHAGGSGYFTTGLSGANAALTVSSGPLRLQLGFPDVHGIASLRLTEDVFLDLLIVDNTRLCVQLSADGSSGSIDCDGGTAYDIVATRDSLAPGTAFTIQTGQGEPAGSGHGELIVEARLQHLAAGDSTPCDDVIYNNPAQTVGFTTSNGRAMVAGTVLSLDVAGAPFDCPQFSIPESGGQLSAPIPANMLPIGDVANALRLAEVSSDGTSCGDGITGKAEECDDQDTVGGDGCAANCTDEFTRIGVFEPAETVATVQTEGFPIIINLSGQQVFRFGTPRSTETRNAKGEVIFAANEMPVVMRASELSFDPVRVTGLVCACVRGVPVESFGPGNFGNGSFGCTDGALRDIAYRLIQDHNTTPFSDGNRLSLETDTPDDPGCDDVSLLPGGTTSSACIEGDPTAESCANDPGMEEEHPHIGICNGPRQLNRSGGPAPDGSAFIHFNAAIALLQDRGLCTPNGRLPNGQCEFADYGPDCLPCTDDDAEMGTAENLPLTTDVAEGAVIDANNSESAASIPGLSVQIEKDADCLGPCITTVNGALFDCNQILSGSPAAGALAVAYPQIDAATIGDNVTTLKLSSSLQRLGTATATRTRTPVRTPSATGTHTHTGTATQPRSATPTFSVTGTPTATQTRAATRTMTSTPTPVATRTATETPRIVRLAIGSAVGAPGESVDVVVSLDSAGATVAATANDLEFDRENLDISPSGCRVNPALGKMLVTTVLDDEGTFGRLRLFVQSTTNAAPISDGILYTCAVGIRTGTLPGAYPLLNLAPRAFSPAGEDVPNVEGQSGSVTVSLVPPVCVGDCDSNRRVTVNELVIGVNVALTGAGLERCSVFDANGDGAVGISELVRGVGALLSGC